VAAKKYKIISEIERKPNCQRRKLQLEFINQKLHKPFWTIFVQRVRFGFYFNQFYNVSVVLSFIFVQLHTLIFFHCLLFRYFLSLCVPKIFHFSLLEFFSTCFFVLFFEPIFSSLVRTHRPQLFICVKFSTMNFSFLTWVFFLLWVLKFWFFGGL